MELYAAARTFIVDEAELEATVERLFAPDYFRRQGSANLSADNIWGVAGGAPAHGCATCCSWLGGLTPKSPRSGSVRRSVRR